MYTDYYLTFDPVGTAITVSANSTNTLDLLNGRDLGVGDNDIDLAVNIGTAFSGGTSLVVAMQASADNSTFYVIAQSRAYLTAELTSGKKLLPINIPAMDGILGVLKPRYLRLAYTVVGTYTAGTLYAGLVMDREDRLYYPIGVTITN
jgi:hypothetical protein